MSAAENPRAVIGGNLPPLGERLLLDYSGIVTDAKDAIDDVPSSVPTPCDDMQAGAYVDQAAAIKALLDEANGYHETEKKPFLDGGREVDNFFRFRADLKAAADRLARAVGAYQTAKRNAAIKAQQEQEKREREAAEMFGGDEPAAPTPIAPEATRVVSFSGAMAAGSVRWDFRVTDAAKVPREYLMLNEPAIRAALAGLKAQGKKVEEVQIPGVEAFEAVRAAIRR